MKHVLILHGWGSCAKNWQQVKEELERGGCKVYLFDLPGFGQNAFLEKAWSIDDYVGWIKNQINNLEIVEPFFLLGHSFGGSIAVKLSLKYPEKIKKLFLISPALVRRKTFKGAVLKKAAKVFSFLPLSFKKIIYGKVIKSDYPLQAGPKRDTYLRIIQEDLSDRLSEISVDTYLFWGERDKTTPLKDAFYIKERVSGAKLEVFPSLKHSPHLESPKVLVEKILKIT